MILRDKVAVVTGSSTGIGRAVAIKFAEHGAKLVVNSKTSVSGGQAVVEEIKKLGREAIYLQADVTQPEQVENLFRQTLAAFGRVDILVNNAGVAGGMPFLESTKEHWLQALEANFLTAVLCSREAAKIMIEQGGGKIINTSSVRGIGHTGREGIMGYSAGKAAMINFTKTLAKELAPSITVNTVAPGFVHTAYMDRVSEEMKANWLQHIPLKRFIMPEEIAEAFLFLASSDIVTGEVLVADGGFTLKIA